MAMTFRNNRSTTAPVDCVLQPHASNTSGPA
jgi:hypothetical protein